MKRIAIVIQNVIQWYAVRPLVELLMSKKLPTDILIFDPINNPNDYHEIANATKSVIKRDGFKITNWPTEKEYTIGLAPYSDMINFKCKYRLGYCYGAVTTKPALTLQPEHKMNFHGMFVHDTYTAELFSVYGRTNIVPYLYLKPVKHQKNNQKPVVLYLPTYNEPSVPATANALLELKNNYYIITKGHHGTDHLNEEGNKKNILKEIADENYDSNQYIMPLFEKADIVISDNSGATMDALYANIPVIMSVQSISPSINNIKPIQQTLIEQKVIPHVSDINATNLKAAIEFALTKKMQRVQRDASDKLFPVKNGGALDWYKIIENYLNDVTDQNYCKLHDYYIEKWQNLKEQNLQVEAIKKQLYETRIQLEHYEKSRAHRIVDKILSNRHKKQSS